MATLFVGAGYTGERVLELMLELNRETGSSLVLVTHDAAIASRMARVLQLHDGRLRDVTGDYRS